MSCAVFQSGLIPHSPFSLLRAFYFWGHIVGVTSLAVFRSMVFSYRISNGMYTESSANVSEEASLFHFDLKDENILASLILVCSSRQCRTWSIWGRCTKYQRHQDFHWIQALNTVLLVLNFISFQLSLMQSLLQCGEESLHHMCILHY